MLKKRLVGVITIRDGIAVQSIGYRRYLPLGDPGVLVENLDRWGADEVVLQVIDASRAGSGPDFHMIERISKRRPGVPLLYGGGIRTAAEGVRVVQAGADRVVVDAMLRDNPEGVTELAEQLGAQAIVASIPASYDETGGLRWLDYRTGREEALSGPGARLLETGIVSEALLIDWKHEGAHRGFDERLLTAFPVKTTPLIVFGGISEAPQMRSLLEMPRVVAVCVGNFLNYREHSIQKLKEALPGMPLRPAVYESKYSYSIHG